MSKLFGTWLGLYMLAGLFAGPVFSGPVFSESEEKGLVLPLQAPISQNKEMLEKEPEVLPARKGLITLNLLEVDIREALSALAMKTEINISAAKEVSGKISVHLFKVTLLEALNAICMAGGYAYEKYGDLFFISKPKKAEKEIPAETSVRVFRLKYAEISKIQDVLSALPDMRMVKIHDASRTIVVEDTEENIKRVEAIVKHWDVKPKQVLIEAKILEIELTDDMTLGIDWAQMLGNANLATSGFSLATLPTTVPTSPVGAVGSGIFGNIISGAGTRRQFTAAIDALQSKTKINTLSAPKILAINGKPARVQVGGQQGYRVTAVSDGIATESIKFIDTGTILLITPFITEDGQILLNVAPSIDAARIEGGVPVVKTTRVVTSLLAKNGETVFIGGLIQDTKIRTSDGIPCLGNIPILGVLFGRTFRGIGKAELVVLITPQIIDGEIREAEQKIIEKTKKIEENLKKEPLPIHEKIIDFLVPTDVD